jgi:hypothetical protein
MSTARRIKAEYAEKAKIRSKKSGFCAVKRKMRFRQSALELAVHDNAFEKSRAHYWHRLCYSRYYTMFNCKAYSSNCQEKDKLTYAVFGVF